MTVVIAAGGLCHWLAWRLKLPAILLFLAFGILLGPVLGWFNAAMLTGDWLPSFVSLAVAVVLFEGSITLKLTEIRGLERVVRNLVTFGALAGGAATTIAAGFIVRLPWELAALFGALTVVTGPTVITPLLRTVRPGEAVTRILQWEGIVIDPLGALLAVLIFNFIAALAEQHDPTRAFTTFALGLATGGGIGLLGGWLWGLLLKSRWLPEYLQTVCTLAAVLTVCTAANQLVHESGLLAVTVTGIILANTAELDLESISSFKENLTLVLVATLFILLAACLELQELAALGWRPLALVAVMQGISRPLAVGLATMGTNLSRREKFIIAWIGPRGIIAAAIAALFAIRLGAMGIPEAESLIPLTFAVIIGTVALPGLTARPLARRLGVAEPEPRGFLVIGANPVARSIGTALANTGVRVLLADTSWNNVRAARREGLVTYYGNPTSEHADRHLNLVGIGRLLGLSMHDEFNFLAALRYRGEFGRRRVFCLQSPQAAEKQEKQLPAQEFRGRPLFGAKVTYANLASTIGRGGTIHRTELTPVFTFEKFLAEHGRRAMVLFTIDAQGFIRPTTAEESPAPHPGRQVIYLAEPEPEPPAEAAEKSAADAVQAGSAPESITRTAAAPATTASAPEATAPSGTEPARKSAT
ncbi:MAG: sodium:proton antiporter [Deltaproteobacteria bacterium]|nr:sodium:proton antiporter [Candidatus Anaeroferrophillacea bacterium]